MRTTWVVALIGLIACGDDKPPGGDSGTTCAAGDLACFLDHLVVTEGGQPLDLVPLAKLPTPSPLGVDAEPESIGGVVWITVDDGRILRSRSHITVAATAAHPLRAINGVGDNEIVAAGDMGTVMRWNGGTWSSQTGAAATASFAGVGVTAGTDAWVGGATSATSGVTCFADLANVTCTTSPGTLPIRAVWMPPGGFGTGVFWATGGTAATGFLMRSDDSTPFANPTNGYAIWGSSSSNIWNAGTELQHWNGSALSTVTFPHTGTLRALAGTSATDVWVAEDGAGIHHFDGTTWSAATPMPERVNAISAFATQDVWAVGEHGMIMRFDGTSWAQIPNAIATTSLTGVYVSGSTIVPTPGGGGSPSPPSITGGLGTITFTTTTEVHPVTIPWSDPANCRPSFCFTPCPKGSRCFAASRCTHLVDDHAMSGTTTLGVRYSAASTAHENFDLWVTPISRPGCMDPIVDGGIVGDALVGDGNPIDQVVEPAPKMPDAGTGSDDYSSAFDITGTNCVEIGCTEIPGCRRFRYTCNGTVSGPVGTVVNPKSGADESGLTIDAWTNLTREMGQPRTAAWTSVPYEELVNPDQPVPTRNCAGSISYTHDTVLISSDSENRDIVCSGGAP